SSNSFEFGARSRDPGYWPANGAAAKCWFRSALKFAGEIAVSDLPAAAEVRAAIADQLRGLWTVAGLFDEVEQTCRAIAAKHFWHESVAARAHCYDQRPAPSHSALHRPHYFPWYGDLRYWDASSRAPRVLSPVRSAISYSFTARSRWPVISK